MLHHAVMTDGDFALLAELLALLTTHGNVRLRSMSQAAHGPLPLVTHS
jgi:hypothetical protein